MRNALLLIKALKNERIREVRLCVNGFNVFTDKYPYLCKFRTSQLYPRPYAQIHIIGIDLLLRITHRRYWKGGCTWGTSFTHKTNR